MEQHSVSQHTHIYSVLPLSSAARCIKVPDTPPLTPVEIFPRTPRKPAQPRQTAHSVDRDSSAIISFKMVQSPGMSSPSLQITSILPSKPAAACGARRRLWVQPGETCEPLTMHDVVPGAARARPNEAASPKRNAYVDGVDADDEMEGHSSISCFSPPYSPGSYETDNVSETATKPSSSSYPPPTEVKERKSAHYVSPKARSAPKSKTCASCKTKKTPLWRDSEDGTPYCNACGIRFKKYRFRCSACSYIPRKDEREVSKLCCQCGSPLVHCKISSRY